MPSAAYTITAQPNHSLHIVIHVDAGTALEVKHDGRVVLGYVGNPQRIAFVIINAGSSVVAGEDNPANEATTDAVVRRYTIPPQPAVMRQCPGAAMVLEGVDLRGTTPEPGPAGPTLRGRRGLLLRSEHSAKRASSWAIRIEFY
ncbi:hypothetical protein HDU90_001190 [Geranomyces variabilis]|nr:hypothetical protein HDU90_001190 [Geranomyces variabilis]